MKDKPPISILPDIPVEEPPSENEQISQNIHAVLDFYTRENGKISYWQRLAERIWI